MILSNLELPHKTGKFNIVIDKNIVKEIFNKGNHVKESIRFDNAIAFPGLINMHDHLAFNHYPSLKSKVYSNHIEWSSDIHNTYSDIITKVKNIPLSAKIAKGELKNLLCGFTTVCDHEAETFSLKVLDNYRDYNYLHSIKYDKYWKVKLLTRSKSNPWIVHLNEGRKNDVEKEIEILHKWNWFNRKIIAVHGISIKPNQMKGIDALIWCPESNMYLYNQTADIKTFSKQKIPVFLGSDSSITGSYNIWNHIRLACDLYGSIEEVYKMLTENPSLYFDKFKKKGFIDIGKQADLVIARKKHTNYWKSFYSTNPNDILLVIKNGQIISFNKELNIDLDLSKYKLISSMGCKNYILNDLTKFIDCKNYGFKSSFDIDFID